MGERFPDRYTPEIGLPYWQGCRTEDRACKTGPWSCFSYLRKLVSKKRGAPVEEVEHFDRHRELLRDLRAPAAAPADSRLALVGDLMWVRDDWSSFLDPRVRDYLNAHGAVVGNLETVVSARFPVKSFWPDYATYNSHPDLLRSFRRPDGRNTFSALSAANNHAFDYGADGVRDTHAFLRGEGVPQSGLRVKPGECPYATFRIGDVTCGFYATTYGLNPGCDQNGADVRINESYGADDSDAPFDLEGVRRALADMAADGVDVRIVAMHWGYEFEYYPAPRHARMAREIVRAGADLIVGAHPHVQQPCEVLFVNGYEDRYPEPVRRRAAEGGATLRADGRPRKALVAYSLGNFATTMWTFACRVGWVLSLGLTRDPESRRVDWEFDASAFVVNVPRTPRGRGRKLLLAGDYASDLRESGRTVPPWQQNHFEFLTRHLWGPPRAGGE